MAENRQPSGKARSLQKAFLGAIAGGLVGVLSVTLLRLLGIGDVGPLGLFLMVTAGMACGVLISVGGIAYLIQLARSQRELLRERGGILSLLSRTTSGRTRAIWLDVLAGLHVGASFASLWR